MTATAEAPSGPEAEESRGSLGGKAFWTLADQGVSSLTNFGLSIIVASSVTADAFGAFSIALLTFSFVIGLSRATVTDPLMIRYSAESGEAQRQAIRMAAGSALTVGVIGGLVCVVAGLLVPNQDARTALLALAGILPALMVQDSWRYGFFAMGRPKAAALNDTVWAVVQFGLAAALLTTGRDSMLLLTLVWGLAALAGGLVGCLQLRMLPDVFATRRWFRENKHLNVRMGIDFVLNMGAVNLSTYVVTAIVGLAGVGGLRAAQVLLGPLQLLFSGMSSFILPMLSTRVAQGRRLRGAAGMTALAAFLGSACWVLALVLMPSSVGSRAFGESWAGARDSLIAMSIVSLSISVAMGASLGLKALGKPNLLLRVTLVQAPLILGLGSYGAVQGGGPGAAIGFAAAQIVGAVLSWIVFLAEEAGAGEVYARHRRGVGNTTTPARHAVRRGKARPDTPAPEPVRPVPVTTRAAARAAERGGRPVPQARRRAGHVNGPAAPTPLPAFDVGPGATVHAQYANGRPRAAGPPDGFVAYPTTGPIGVTTGPIDIRSEFITGALDQVRPGRRARANGAVNGRPRYVEYPEISGFEPDPPRTNGHEENGHEVNGHEVNGHEVNGHEVNGHEVNGHEADQTGHPVGPLPPDEYRTVDGVTVRYVPDPPHPPVPPEPASETRPLPRYTPHGQS